MVAVFVVYFFFFFNDTATTEIYTLSLHDALPILYELLVIRMGHFSALAGAVALAIIAMRSEEHTSELQSQSNLVCRLLLEKKKKKNKQTKYSIVPICRSLMSASDSFCITALTTRT